MPVPHRSFAGCILGMQCAHPILGGMENRQRATGVALMLASSSASQTGAGIGALAFPVLGPVGVVAVRQWVAGVILLAVGRPHVRALTGGQWRPIVLLA